MIGCTRNSGSGTCFSLRYRFSLLTRITREDGEDNGLVSLKIVTGCVAIPGHPRSAAEYGMLGEWFETLEGVPIRRFYDDVSSCWLAPFIKELPFEPTWSVADNPQKNSMNYHIVIHQKFEWLYQASRLDANPDVFIWMDYGIRHLHAVTTAIALDFLERVRGNDLAVPGCWPVRQIDDRWPCWRFCGGLMVVPRQHIQPLRDLIQTVAKNQIIATRNVTWEVNTLARAEMTGKLPFRWYKADHNETMFRNY